MQVQLELFRRLPGETPEEIFARVFRQVGVRARSKWRALPLTLSFERYANANSRIRVRGGRLEVRISDAWQDAPEDVLEALAEILVAKLMGTPPLPGRREAYKHWMGRPEFRQKLLALRRVRGRKHVAPAEGRSYDLESMYGELNGRYFAGKLERVRLGWSRKASRTQLGHYDPSHHAIVLNPILDQPQVPRAAVEFVLYHEMLHVKHPVEHSADRRLVHTRAFKHDERKFDGWKEANEAIKRLCSAPVDL